MRTLVVAVLALMMGLMLFESGPGLDLGQILRGLLRHRRSHRVQSGPTQGEVGAAPSK